jgi:hypothetical protein
LHKQNKKALGTQKILLGIHYRRVTFRSPNSLNLKFNLTEKEILFGTIGACALFVIICKFILGLRVAPLPFGHNEVSAFLYRKTLQINGSLGHEDDFKKIRNVLKQVSLKGYYKGFNIRVLNSMCYLGLALLIGNF